MIGCEENITFSFYFTFSFCFASAMQALLLFAWPKSNQKVKNSIRHFPILFWWFWWIKFYINNSTPLAVCRALLFTKTVFSKKNCLVKKGASRGARRQTANTCWMLFGPFKWLFGKYTEQEYELYGIWEQKTATFLSCKINHMWKTKSRNLTTDHWFHCLLITVHWSLISLLTSHWLPFDSAQGNAGHWLLITGHL